jgi:hypothetical protein
MTATPLAVTTITPGANEAPGLEWAKRYTLHPSMKEMLDDAPLLKMHNGEVKLNKPKLDEIKGPADAQTAVVLDRFRSALAGISVPVCNSPIPTPTPRPKTKRAREWEDAEDDDRVMCAPISSVRPSAEECATIAAAPPVIAPVGVCAGDRITFFDRTNKWMTHQYVTVPEDQREGGTISGYYEPRCGQEGVHVLMVDGEHGIATAARQKTQHAIRLFVHRKHCRNPVCNVLGCRDESYETVFKEESSPRMKRAYEVHWSRERRRKQQCMRQRTL